MRRGLARTFQINQLFGDLTPLETIGLAVSERLGSGATGGARRQPSRVSPTKSSQLLERFRLADVMRRAHRTLPYGKQRLLEIALAIACKPRVLLLDEPAAGVPEAERHEILATVAALPADVTVLLIEHDMDLVFALPTASRCWSTARCSSRARPTRSRATRASRRSISARARDG